ncbi:MAG: 2-C-methyl-D-erythritol 2,4-cyclodiphosphate synthase [Fidelibacterota bacterium]
MRIGQGIDTHQLVEGIPLVIGGVSIPFSKGSKGHSDGDTLLHALVDALLGAAAEGDIGSHFPSSDPKWKSADSRIFVKHAMEILSSRKFVVENVDCTIILQEPVLKPHIPMMRRNIAELLEIPLESVSVKATTTDHLGFIGRGEGIAATVMILLERSTDF